MAVLKAAKLHFRKNGVYYNQVKRADGSAIYSLRYSADGKVIGFDVMKILKWRYGNYQKCKYSKDYNGQPEDILEYLPSSESYGKYAWSFNTFEAAQNKLKSLK